MKTRNLYITAGTIFAGIFFGKVYGRNDVTDFIVMVGTIVAIYLIGMSMREAVQGYRTLEGECIDYIYGEHLTKKVCGIVIMTAEEGRIVVPKSKGHVIPQIGDAVCVTLFTNAGYTEDDEGLRWYSDVVEFTVTAHSGKTIQGQF